MIPIIVMSKGCVERMHTLRWLDALGLSYTVVTHTKAQASTIAGACGGKVIATGLDDLVANRNWAFSLVPPNKWFIGMDDNIQALHKVRDDYYGSKVIDQTTSPVNATSWRQVYRTVATHDVIELVEELIQRCKRNETVYGGFASMENPFFRLRKWSDVRFVKSKFFVMLNVPGLKWGGGNYAHDSWMSAYVVAKYGRIVVNNWVNPVHKMYEQGGLGHGKERRVELDPMLDDICAQFYGLVARGRGENTALRFLLTNPESIRKWRQSNPYFDR